MSKRVFDIFCSTAGLVLLSPIFIIVSLFIKLTSPGPVFFKQRRVGKNGVVFEIFKFRTMIHNSGSKSLVTRKHDTRITGIGRILRISKLDELPQLINVFIGNMSIVGPRPEIPELVETYNEEQLKLLQVKPGITSPATIYHRDEEEVIANQDELMEYHRKVLIPKKASYDLEYLKNVGIWYDFKLIILTLVSVFTNESGYMRGKTLKNRHAIILISHLVLSALAYYISFIIRFDGKLPWEEFIRFARTLPVAILLDMVFLSYYKLNQGYWRYADMTDGIRLIKVSLGSLLGFIIFEYFFLDVAYPTGVYLTDAVITLCFFVLLRFSSRAIREAYYPITPQSKEKILILGANDECEALIRNIQQNPDMACHVVGIIDNDPHKQGLRIHRHKIIGTSADLDKILTQQRIDTIINTYSSLNPETVNQLSSCSRQYNLTIKTLPTVKDVLSGAVSIHKLKSIRYEELLGRDEVQLDISLLESSYCNQVVLVTGAGGSIGSELVRQIVRFKPKEMILVDKDETLLYEIDCELKDKQVQVQWETVICDIRDRERLHTLLGEKTIDIVLHAAAYKHVPLMESHCADAIINNVIGTANVYRLAQTLLCKKFVLISTDKAVRPTSVMGASKRLAERLIFEGFEKSAMKVMAVRFGNVLGSRGSVVPLFKRQIKNGGPVKITDAEVNRFFMSIPEASQLVLQAGAMGNGGELFILRMGHPIKILDLAYNMIQASGLQPDIDIKIEFTGLRPGEKLYEELLTDLENTHTTTHEKIMVVQQDHQHAKTLFDEIKELSSKINQVSNEDIRFFLKKQVPEYQFTAIREIKSSYEHDEGQDDDLRDEDKNISNL